MKKTYLILIALFIPLYHFACTGGDFAQGTLTPAAGYQTEGVVNGDYFEINVICGNTYNFDFCGNGGSSGSLFPEISILDITGTTEYAFSGYIGGCSTLSWTATYTGTIRLLITDSGCWGGGSWSGTMAYNEISSGPLSASFNLSPAGCSSATATVTGTPGGTFSFNPAPGDGATIDANTGTISNGISGTEYFVDYTICGTTQNNSIIMSAGDASFTLTVACGGGTPTITGNTGGSFEFNPAPGDGAQINSITGIITNGTVGTTYYAEYTVCGTSTIQSVTVLDDNCWTLNGDAQYINVSGEQCIQLTDAINGQTGCSWNSSTVSFASDFTLTLDYYFGTGGNNGADGNTFTFQPSASAACGTAGGQLGAGGLTNALSIEFDTYDNDNPTHLYDMSCDHIAVEIDGNMQGAAPLCGPVCAKAGGGNIDDGGTYEVDIVWDVSTTTLEVYFDGVLRLTCVNDFITNAFGGSSDVYWGATSATGGLNNQQYFCPSSVVILPVELSEFYSVCHNSSEEFVWSTVSEHRVDYFQLEYTYDGLVFYPIEKIEATGNTTDEHRYSIDVLSKDTKQRYYRLKSVDEDGKFEYTDIISSRYCGNSILINTIQQEQGLINISFNDEVSFALLNQMGQVIREAKSYNKSITLDKTGISSGIYFIRASNKDGQVEQVKLFVH